MEWYLFEKAVVFVDLSLEIVQLFDALLVLALDLLLQIDDGVIEFGVGEEEYCTG